MNDQTWLAEQFEHNRSYLREIGYRLLGSRADAEDAVQDAWLRLSSSDTEAIRNLSAWLTTVVSHICLDRLRERAAHPEQIMSTTVPELVLTEDWPAHRENPPDRHGAAVPTDPAEEAILADSVQLALVVVLDTLSPSERVAFVLHDMFGVPFDQIARLLEKTPAASRQLASRARRRVRQAEPSQTPTANQVRRGIVDAFFAAAHSGDFEALLELLHPEAILRADGGRERPAASVIIRGGNAVAHRAMMFDRPDATLLPVLAGKQPAVVVLQGKEAVSVMVFTVAGTTAREARIRRVDILLDPDRLDRLDVKQLVFTSAPPPMETRASESQPASVVI